MPDWIKFTEVDLRDGRKTKVWAVMSIDGRCCIGRIGWYSPWRKYSFVVTPKEEQIILEEDCLRLIASFCEQQTKQRKAERREEIKPS